MRDDQHKEVNWDRCRHGSYMGYDKGNACKNPPVVIGEWRYGPAKGLLIPWCDEHNERLEAMKNVVPWYPYTSAEELEADFWKELYDQGEDRLDT